jgi:hypothetical protein
MLLSILMIASEPLPLFPKRAVVSLERRKKIAWSAVETTGTGQTA